MDPDRLFATRKADAMARLEARGIPTTWVDVWVEWWDAQDATNSRHHPGFWEQGFEHIATEWDAGRTVPPAPDPGLSPESDATAGATSDDRPAS